MAGDWLKMEHSLPDKPEVLAISSAMGIEPDAVVGKCFRVWRWFDQHTKDGHAAGVTTVTLLSVIGHGNSNELFLTLMKKAGWLHEDEAGLSLPNFERHNGETAKTRGLATKRKQKQRAQDDDDVTEASRYERDTSVTREEKRREENKYSSSFAEFWTAYPKKVGKGDAEKAWSKIKPDADLLARILKAVGIAARSADWTKEGGQFIPHPSTWLNGKRWEDALPVLASVSGTVDPRFKGAK